MKIHKEGYTIIAGTVLFLAITYFFISRSISSETLRISLLILSLGLTTLVIQFFRVPKRSPHPSAGEIIAPCDGKVVVIEETVENEYLKDKRRQISIFMSPLNVHVNWNPIGGSISYFKYHPGKYLVAWHPKSSTENERTTAVIKNNAGVEVLFRQIAGAVARRIRWYIKEGDKVGPATEMGFIKFGSRVDVFVPLDAEITVALGQKTVGQMTVLARLKDPEKT